LCVASRLFWLRARREFAHPVAEPVDARERREGVVDGWGQGADGDLDELVDRVGEVLSERAVGPCGMGPVESSGHVASSFWRPDLSDREPFKHEMTRSVQQLDSTLGPRRQAAGR